MLLYCVFSQIHVRVELLVVSEYAGEGEKLFVYPLQVTRAISVCKNIVHLTLHFAESMLGKELPLSALQVTQGISACRTNPY